MNHRIRIIKRESGGCLHDLPPGHGDKNARQNERQIVCTIKRWIAEGEQRRDADRLRAFALVK